jgi:FMN phosphatase YigB (HAD superfamily)
MGRVLIDFDFAHFGARISRLAAVDLDAVRVALTGGELANRYETGLLGDLDFHGEVCRRLGCHLSWDEFVRAWNSIFDPAPILSEELIAALAGRAQLWVVSNTNKIHFDFILERYPLMRHFRGYVLSHEVRALKPDARIFHAALERAGSRPEETLFVDDQPANVEAAKQLGLDAFQFQGVERFERELAARGLL